MSRSDRSCVLGIAVPVLFRDGAHSHSRQGPGGYPDRPVRVIVPVAAAGGTDIIARIVLTQARAT